MNEESRAMRDASERARESERGILPSSSHRKTLLRWHAQAGTHTHLTLDRSAAWLAGCTAGFQAGSTLARTHIYIKPLSAYGRTIGRPVGRSVCEREEERQRGKEAGRKREGGGQTDGRMGGRRDFIRAKRPCGCCGEQAWQVI